MSTHSERHGDSKVFTGFRTREVYPKWTHQCQDSLSAHPLTTFPPVIRIAISLAAYQAIARPFLAAHRIKVKLALFNEIANSGEDTRSAAESRRT
jgi:hypothetical protein